MSLIAQFHHLLHELSWYDSNYGPVSEPENASVWWMSELPA